MTIEAESPSSHSSPRTACAYHWCSTSWLPSATCHVHHIHIYFRSRIVNAAHTLLCPPSVTVGCRPLPPPTCARLQPQPATPPRACCRCPPCGWLPRRDAVPPPSGVAAAPTHTALPCRAPTCRGSPPPHHPPTPIARFIAVLPFLPGRRHPPLLPPHERSGPFSAAVYSPSPSPPLSVSPTVS